MRPPTCPQARISFPDSRLTLLQRSFNTMLMQMQCTVHISECECGLIHHHTREFVPQYGIHSWGCFPPGKGTITSCQGQTHRDMNENCNNHHHHSLTALNLLSTLYYQPTNQPTQVFILLQYTIQVQSATQPTTNPPLYSFPPIHPCYSASCITHTHNTRQLYPRTARPDRQTDRQP